MSDREIPQPEPDADALGPDAVAVTTALLAVPDPPPGRLEDAVQAALAAYDERRAAVAAGPEDVVTPPPGPNNRWLSTHRRLAAVAAALVVLAGLAGLLVARNPLRSTGTDTAAMSQEAALDLQMTTTVVTPDARARDAAGSAAPSTASTTDTLVPSSATATPMLGTFTDSAALLAEVRATSAGALPAAALAPATTAAPPTTTPSSASPAAGATDDAGDAATAAPTAGGSGCAPVTGTTALGDAVLGTTRVVVTLEVATAGPSTRIRVYAAVDCRLLLDEPLAG